jgi:DNA polymerase III delta subunit
MAINYILYGQNQLEKREFLAQLKEKFSKKYSTINIDQLYFDSHKISPQQLQTKLQTVPFLGQQRLLIIFYSLAPFTPSKERSSQRNREIGGSQKSEDSRKKLSLTGKILGEQLTAVPASTNLVIVEEELTGNPVFNKLRRGPFRIKEFKPIYGYRLENWVKRRAKSYKLSIGNQALALLINYLGNDSSQIDQELKKLGEYLSFYRQQEITALNIREVVVPSPKLIIFELLDNVIEQNHQAALRRLEDMLQRGTSEAYLLAMIESAISKLLLARDYQDEKGKASPSILQKRFGWHPFVAQKSYRQAQRLNKKALIKIYQRLLETEVRIKSGSVPARLQLTLLFSQL